MVALCQAIGDKVLTVSTLGPWRTGVATSQTQARTEEEEQRRCGSSPAWRLSGEEGGDLAGRRVALGHSGAPGPAQRGGG
jgi:hypothetical protein